MALVAAGVDKLVVAVRMAVLTLDRGMRSCEREFCRRMVERRRGPGGHRMACCACCGEPACHMVRVGDAVEVGLMAIDAILVKSGINIVHVAACARNRLMGTDEGERSVVVIERRWRPDARGMALVARLCKISRRMIRVCRILVIGLMAHVAGRVRELVVAVRVAILALHSDMCSGEGEFRRSMVECCRSPSVHRMTGRARCRKITPRVAGVIRGGKIGLVAIETISVEADENIVHMAAGARHGLMRSDERIGRATMVEN